jgi:hypothetical protein
MPPAPPVAAPVRTGKTWLFNPWFDLLLVAFALWPLVVLLRNWELMSGRSLETVGAFSITFWQIYFLTTPHRWITLALVYGDRDKFAERPRMFVGLALGAVGVCLAFALAPLVVGWFRTGDLSTVSFTAQKNDWFTLFLSLEFLMALDFIWNAWHFAAQHSGIHRIYGRMARPDVTRWAMFEKVVFRVFTLYVLFRVALVAAVPALLEHWKAENTQVMKDWRPALQICDLVLLICPVLLLVREFLDWRPSVLGRLVYLVSVLAVYTGTLIMVHVYEAIPVEDPQALSVLGTSTVGLVGSPLGPGPLLAAATVVPGRAANPTQLFWGNLLLSFVLAIAMFHATEYLAIVSWSVKRKRNPSGIFAHLAPMWGMALVIYLIALGLGGLLVNTWLQASWVFLNLIVSFLHYGYDGMIWKQARPTAKPLTA